MALEAGLELTIVDEAEADGWFVRKVQWPGRKGAPDRVFIKGGRTVWIEFKRPDGKGHLARIQARNRDDMIAAGAEVYVVETYAHARQILGL
jgi:hypothetical protein